MTSRNLSALATLASGIGLCTAGFVLSEAHTVNDSLLFYMGECLLYAGGIFNIRLLVLREIRDFLTRRGKGADAAAEQEA
ncbi:MAG: hypothetical protein IJ659_00900 [Alloprevotella sp.]|nr:hypothetical protein [Alloprevotella sp.]